MDYVDQEMPWAQWICCLSTALQLDEVDRYERFVMAGGKKEEWRWTFYNPHGEAGENIAESIIKQWSGQMKAEPAKGSLDDAVTMGVVKKAQMVGDRYVREDGTLGEVPDGYLFVPKRA